MAIDLDGSSWYSYPNVASLVGSPLTISAWVYPDAVNIFQDIFVKNNGAESLNHINFWNDGVASSGALAFARTGSTTKIIRTATALLQAGQWQHVLANDDGTMTAAGADIYYGGVVQSPYVTSTDGATEIDGNGLWYVGPLWDGRMADVAVWNVKLDANERTSLAFGHSPLLIRPQSLLFYTPLIRSGNDLKGKTATATSTPVAIAHPRQFYPMRQVVPFAAAAAAGGRIFQLAGHGGGLAGSPGGLVA